MLGISFGKKKTRETQNVDQTVTGTQQQTGNNTSTTSGTQTSTGQSNTSSTGTSSTSTNGATTQSGLQTTQQTGSAFGADVLAALSGNNISQFISNVLTNPGGAATQELGDFDAEEFINGTMAAAKSASDLNLGSAVRGVTNLFGGNESENSMTALLGGQLRDQSAANLGGVAANAVKTAQDIAATRASAVAGAGASETNALAQVLNALKGGVTTQTGVQQDNTTATTTGGSTTNTSENSQQNTSQQTVTMQQVQEMINQLLSTNQHTVGTTTGTQSSSGGGISLGI